MLGIGIKQGVEKAIAQYYNYYDFDVAIIPQEHLFFPYPSVLKKNTFIRLSELPEVKYSAILNSTAIQFKNLDTNKKMANRTLLVGVDDNSPIFINDALKGHLKIKNSVIVNSKYTEGPFEGLKEGDKIEINGISTLIAKIIPFGSKLYETGVFITRNDNFSHLTANRNNKVNYGLLKLKKGVNTSAFIKKLMAVSDQKVKVLTRKQLLKKEREYMFERGVTGMIVNYENLITLLLLSIIITLLCYTEICSHINYYFTLKVTGFSDSFLLMTIFCKIALIVSFAFIASNIIILILQSNLNDALSIPIILSPATLLSLFIYLMVLCMLISIAALIRIKQSRYTP